MAPQDARERFARRRLVIDPRDIMAAIKIYAQVHDVVSEAIDEGLLSKAKLGPERYCKLVRLLGDVGAMWKESKQ